MRGSGWLLPAITLVIWVAAVGWPAVATILESASGDDQAAVAGAQASWSVFQTTTLFAIGITLGAIALGWAPGRLLGRLASRGFAAPSVAAMIVPLCLPAYIVFWCWSQTWPAGSTLYAWAAADNERIAFLRGATLVIGMVCWSWPLVALPVAAVTATASARQRAELMRLDGAGVVARFVERLRTDGRGLAIGALLVFLTAFNNTTCFDLAGVFSFGNELRALAEFEAPTAQVLVVSWPAIAAAVLGAAAVWVMLRPNAERRAVAGGRVAVGGVVGTLVIWTVTIAVPLVIFLSSVWGVGRFGEFWSIYSADAMNTALLALAAGAGAAIIAIGFAAIWQDRRRWIRWHGHTMAVGLLIAAAVPGTIVAVALEAGYNLGPLDDLVYLTPAIVILGLVARFGFIGALLGRWLALREPKSLSAMRSLDGASTLIGFIQSARPQVVIAATASLSIVTVLAMSEIPVSARVHPPGVELLAPAVLNALHYQRPWTVAYASLGIMAFSVMTAAGVALLWARMPRRGALVGVASVALGILLFLPGCQQEEPSSGKPLEVINTFGTPGLSLGQFNYPRAMAIDPQRECIYIVDKTARVQRFGFDGVAQLQWRMPEYEIGQPVGISVSPDGRVFVGDSHYHRVLVFDADGNELMRFGEYGEGPGQFSTFPSDIAFGPEGRLYVAEYGGNDRIQVFTAEGDFLFTFGSFGEGPGQLSRPQSLYFDLEAGELYIADACNHRIVVTDADGATLRTIGQSGAGLGEFVYPYDFLLRPDRTLLVVENGASRVQWLDADGGSLASFGRFGQGAEELQNPWGIDGASSRIFVLDSRNNRVMELRSP